MAELKVGDRAPDFTLPKVDGTGTVGKATLDDEVKNGPVVLAFFPLAFTGVCTKELCTFRDTLADFSKVGAKIFGVSVDTPFSQNEFVKQNHYNFPLLSDYHKEVAPQYGGLQVVAGLQGIAKRAVFIVGKDGRVLFRWVTENPKDLPPFDEIRQVVAKAR